MLFCRLLLKATPVGPCSDNATWGLGPGDTMLSLSQPNHHCSTLKVARFGVQWLGVIPEPKKPTQLQCELPVKVLFVLKF